MGRSREAQVELRGQRVRGAGMTGQRKQAMRCLQLDRPFRVGQVDGTLQGERRIVKELRLWPRYDESGDDRACGQHPVFCGQVRVEVCHLRAAGDLQLLNQQAPVGDRCAHRAVPASLQVDALPRKAGMRSHRGRA